MDNEATLWKLVDGELDPARTEALEAAAERDPALRARIEELRRIKAAVLFGAPEPPEGFPERVVRSARFGLRLPAPEIEEARRFLRRALVAAALLAACGVTYLVVEILPAILRPEVYANPLFRR